MNPYQFFLKHAGYSYDPATQSPMQGRIQNARRLAAAERKARDHGYSFKWTIDLDCTSAHWIADGKDGGRGCNPWQLWQCDFLNRQGYPLSNLGAIDFGRDGEPWGNPYRRVVEAELALEALDNLKGEV
jgi:hypothetical protein